MILADETFDFKPFSPTKQNSCSLHKEVNHRFLNHCADSSSTKKIREHDRTTQRQLNSGARLSIWEWSHKLIYAWLSLKAIKTIFSSLFTIQNRVIHAKGDFVGFFQAAIKNSGISFLTLFYRLSYSHNSPQHKTAISFQISLTDS